MENIYLNEAWRKNHYLAAIEICWHLQYSGDSIRKSHPMTDGLMAFDRLFSVCAKPRDSRIEQERPLQHVESSSFTIDDGDVRAIVLMVLDYEHTDQVSNEWDNLPYINISSKLKFGAGRGARS